MSIVNVENAKPLSDKDYVDGLDYMAYKHKERESVKAKDIQRRCYECYFSVGVSLLKTAQFISNAVTAGDLEIDEHTGIVKLTNKCKEARGIPVTTDVVGAVSSC